MNEDLELIAQDNKLLALIEHPVWAVFVKIVDEDMKALDTISSLVPAEKNRDELIREIEIRYHTIDRVRTFIYSAIDRANRAIEEIEKQSKDSIVNTHHL